MDLLFVALFAGAVALILALLLALKILSREVEDKGMVKFSPKLLSGWSFYLKFEAGRDWLE